MEYRESRTRNEVEPFILSSVEEVPLNIEDQTLPQATNENVQVPDENIDLGYN